MIRVGYEKREGHMALTVDGHAETGPKGADIVCAAVSALVQGLIVTLQVLQIEHPAAISVRELPQSVPPPTVEFPPMLCTCSASFAVTTAGRCGYCGLERPL